MSDIKTVLSDRADDFGKVRIEVVSLVNAVSSKSNGFGDAQAGVKLVLPADKLREHGKIFSHVDFLSPEELACESLASAEIRHRLQAILDSTPIAFHAKRQEQTLLDTRGAQFEVMVKRIEMMLEAVTNNFRRDVNDLIKIFDGFTQPAITLPACNMYQAQAAFAYRGLLDAYRRAKNMPLPTALVLSDAARAQLEKYGVATEGVTTQEEANAFAQGLLQAALQTAPGALHGKEVQLMEQALQAAMAAHEIEPLVITDNLREALAYTIQQARMANHSRSAQVPFLPLS